MYDERIVLRSALCNEYFIYRAFVKGVRTESVHRFGGKNDKLAPQNPRGALIYTVFGYFNFGIHQTSL